MKKLLLLIASLSIAAASFGQNYPAAEQLDPEQVSVVYIEYIMGELSPMINDRMDYGGAIGSAREFLAWFDTLGEELKADVPFRFYIYTCMAEAAARGGMLDDAVRYTREAVAKGCDSFTYVLDLMAIPELDAYPGFREAIAPLKEIDGDYIGVLRRDNDYRPDPAGAPGPVFSYNDPGHEPLLRALEDFDLAAVAGDGDELSRIVNVMDWLHDNVPHNGTSFYPGQPNIHSIFNYSKETGSGVNCRMLATALNECYLALGFKSRLVTCLPADQSDMDCHIINAVWSDEMQKWLWMDPTYSAYVTDGEGKLLGIQEVRQRLVDGLPVEVRQGANWNHRNGITSDFYLYNYMAKNLYILECWQDQAYNTESPERGIAPVYIQLRPYGSGSWLDNNKIVTSDPDAFWQKPY